MKLATWIDSNVENMHIVLICLLNINFGCYGNLKLPLAYIWENVNPTVTWKLLGLGSYYTKDMLSRLSSSEPGVFKESPEGMLHPFTSLKA